MKLGHGQGQYQLSYAQPFLVVMDAVAEDMEICASRGGWPVTPY